MTYSTYISKLRIKLHDLSTLERNRWDGDATTTLFQTSKRPIKDGSYLIKVDGVEKTENTDYTLDKDLGLLTFVSAPASGSDNVEMTYRAYILRDDEYLELINNAIDHFRWKFWKEADDTSSITTTKDQYEYDLSSLTGILYVVNCWYKSSSSSTIWEAIQGLTNWKYLTRQKKLFVNPTFSTSSLPMKIRYLKSFTKGTAISDDLDIPDEWLLPYEYYIKARYYENRVPEKVNETAAVTTMPSYTPAQVMLNIVEYYDKKAEEVAKKIAPTFPTMPVKQLHDGVSL